MSAQRILVFAPHAGIWVHSFPEALVADAVRRAGGELVYVTCDGAFASFCVTMAASGLRAESPADRKEKVCKACRRNRDLLRKDFDFPGYDLESVMRPPDEDRVAKLLEEAARGDLAAFSVDGIPAGTISLYEYMIHSKKMAPALDPAEWDAFRPTLANTLRSLIAAQRILDREKPTTLVVYNTLYSVNAVWRAAANARGIPAYVVHGGPNFARRLQTVIVSRDSTTLSAYRVAAAWPKYEQLPCSGDELAAVTDHFCEVLAGTSVFAYSAPKAEQGADWRARFGIEPDQKFLVATMSSYDEYVAARTIGEMPGEAELLFPTQIEWVRALFDWIRDRPDLFLLVRVHPREFPNKREGRTSEHARMLEAALAELPPNARVNWPADGLSLYDIAEHADVFLNAWSSAGREMSLLGRPVVVYCPSLLLYPPAINYVATTRDAYFAAIETALRDGWSFERIRAAYRSCVVEYVRAVADIADGFDYSEAQPASLIERAQKYAYMVPGLRQRRDLWRRPEVLREQGRIAEVVMSGLETVLDAKSAPRASISLDEETAALKRQLVRLTAVLYRNAVGAPEPGTLRDYLSRALA
jgi:hypothetical protein